MHSKKNSNHHDQFALNSLLPNDPTTDPDFELKDRLKNLLAYEEGKIVLPNGLHVAYKDSKGILTIGYGFNLEDGSAPDVLRQVTTKTTTALKSKSEFLTEQEARALLFIAEEVALSGVRSIFHDYSRLDLPRRVVLAAMVYQMGAGRFSKFRRLIAAVISFDWAAAVQSMVESQWARRDSPKRAHRMADAMRSGTFPPFANLSGASAAVAMRVPATSYPTSPPPTVPVPARQTPAPVASAPQRRNPWPFDN